MYMKNFGEFYNDQIESAATVILSRTQKLSEEKQLKAAEMICEKNPAATVVTTSWDKLSGEQILHAMEGSDVLAQMLMKEAHEHHHDHNGACGCEHEHHHDHDEACGCEHEHHHDHDEACGHAHHHDHEEHCSCDHHHDHHHHHHADEVFTSWGRETPRQYDKDEVERILKTLSDSEAYGIVLRAKGMVPCEDGSWIHFDMVPGEYEIRTGAPDYTGRLCVIGSKLQEEALTELFGL